MGAGIAQLQCKWWAANKALSQMNLLVGTNRPHVAQTELSAHCRGMPGHPSAQAPRPPPVSAQIAHQLTSSTSATSTEMSLTAIRPALVIRAESCGRERPGAWVAWQLSCNSEFELHVMVPVSRKLLLQPAGPPAAAHVGHQAGQHSGGPGRI